MLHHITAARMAEERFWGLRRYRLNAGLMLALLASAVGGHHFHPQGGNTWLEWLAWAALLVLGMHELNLFLDRERAAAEAAELRHHI